MKKVLAIAVHPDDETIGCGGTLLRHILEGDDVYWLIITNMVQGDSYTDEQITIRQEEIKLVSQKYSFTDTFKFDFPTAKINENHFGEIVHKISGLVQNLKPEIIYLPNRSDIHSDHRIIFQAAFSCTKNFRSPFIDRILMMETMSETEFAPATSDNAFIPNVFIDITEQIDKKIEIMNIYKSEVMAGNLPRSINAIMALAAYRGSRIGVNYAESFQLLFERI
jgi:LmbE family N-acetylglucosaminyl deacetylase